MSTHRLDEDIAAGLTGISVFSLGLTMLSQAGLLTGGVPGLALLLQHATGFEIWALLLVVNAPFYVLSILRMGWKLTVRTVLAVCLLALLLKMIPSWIGFDHLAPVYAACIGGVLMGLGLLILFRHRTSLGGFNILALFAQDRFGWRAGYVQMALDALILAAAFFVVEPSQVVLSLVGTAMLNLVIATNHKPGRYMGLS